MGEIIYKRVETDTELRQILELQKLNLKQNLSEDFIHTEGFVYVEHSFAVLKRMNEACPHFIAIKENQVIGYALCMLERFRRDVPVLEGMFNYIDKVLASKELSNLHYLVMGQICVDKAYRGKGVFRNLYNNYRLGLEHEYEAVITEVNAKNLRSLEAHKAIGFECLDRHIEENDHWELIIWQWN